MLTCAAAFAAGATTISDSPVDAFHEVLRIAMDLVFQMWKFLGARRKFWLLPIIIVTVLIGGLLVLAQGSVVAPFIYTLF